jgi:serine/threonine protein kinase
MLQIARGDTIIGLPQEEPIRNVRISRPAARVVNRPYRAAGHLAFWECCRAVVDRDPNAPDKSGPPDKDGGTTVADRGPTDARPPETLQDHSSATWDLNFLLPTSHPQSLGRLGGYEILGRIGQGGMGVVLKAFDVTLQRTVAVKVMYANLAAFEENRRRFLREARTAAAINHPNVVTIHAVDEQRGMPFLVMEYVEGITLSDRIRQGPPFDETSLVRLGSQIAAGLAAAHQRGIIHRDIKPSNIMLVAGLDQVKITDFGLAFVTAEGTRITSADHVVGTPAYMSPEQVTGGKLDSRSDLFSLGCVLYAMAAGRSPFHGSHPLEVARKIEAFVPGPLHQEAPAAPACLSGIVSRLLEKDPDRRYQSAQEVVRALAGEPTPADKAKEGGPPKRHRSWPWVAAVCALAVIVPLTAWRLAHQRTPSLATFFSSNAGLPNPEPAREVTVSQAGTADYRSLSEALAHVGPYSTVRILDDATYEEQEAVEINNPDRWRGLTLMSERHATLVVPGQHVALLLRNTPGVTVRGLHLKAGVDQHGIMILGDARGVTLDGVTFTHPPESGWANLLVSEGARGSAEAPLRVQNCAFEFGAIGILLQKTDKKNEKVAFVRLENNRFRGSGMHVQLNQTVEEVAVEGNVFVEGTGVVMNLSALATPSKVRIGCNTFFRTPRWLWLYGSGPLGRDVLVYNNLVLAADSLDAGGRTLQEVAKVFSFRGNWWEPAPGTEQEGADHVATIKQDIALLSRDPVDPNFLRPPPDSPLGTSGAGGELPRHIGALLPAGRAEKGSPPAP